jgi:pyruvate, orthophosphate dikinase
MTKHNKHKHGHRNRHKKESNVEIVQIQAGHPKSEDISALDIGGKAYGLLRMVKAGVNLPPSFVLSTNCSRQYFKNDKKLPENLLADVKRHIHWLESVTNKSLNSKRIPLIVSVRSGAPVSMPGMMETLLNIGLNDETVHGLIRSIGNPRMAWDSYRRLIQSYAEIVYMSETTEFDSVLKNFLKQDGLKYTSEMDTTALKNLCTEFKQVFKTATGTEFPQDPWKQLYSAISAVFNSWFSQRAETYREINKIDSTTGTACLIQSMVFGNSGGHSGSGVGFTRNPADGKNELFIDYLSNVQGEDIVSGRHNVDDVDTLQRKYPVIYSELQQIKEGLEKEFSDMQDFEFTIEQGELYLLQTRNGKRTPMATLCIAIDLVDEGLITITDALDMLKKINLKELYSYKLHQSPDLTPITSGIIASTGIVSGIITLDEEKAKEYSKKNKTIVLVREETSTNDIGAMNLADAVITVTGGRTSHAAVVARQLGTACIVGCHDIQIDMNRRCIYVEDQIYSEGDFLTVDADQGHIYAGQLKIEKNHPKELLKRIEQWQKDN